MMKAALWIVSEPTSACAAFLSLQLKLFLLNCDQVEGNVSEW